MGGARCSYQNCSQKSDKKTHMFHYPVFDKMRCHQWITNAQKLNYLNLKLSQLKNRMVCQHHFTDDCFMNEMKNKLKNNAIPTEYGPFCTKSYKEQSEIQDNKEIEMPINIDDIENEFTPTTDRKAHLSVKYGDFLTNDVTDTVTLPDYKSMSSIIRDKGMIFNIHDRKAQSSQNCMFPNSNVKKITNAMRVKHVNNKKSIVDSLMFENKLSEPTVMAIEFEELNLNASRQNEIQTSESRMNSDQITEIKPSITPVPSSKKVRIISEKHISEPLKIPPGELQPVSPSIVINVPNKKIKSNIEIDGKEIKTLYVDDTPNLQSTKNVQELDSSLFTYSPRACVTSQIHLDAFNQPTIHIDQMGLNNLVIQNVDHEDAKPIEYLPSEANSHRQETGLFSNIDYNISTAPNVEFVSSSLTGPSVFTLTDLPGVSAMVTDTSYVDTSSQGPQNALLSMESEVLAPSQELVPSAPTKTDSNMSVISKNMPLVKPTSKSISPVKSMARHKLPPEKLAAIEEKRKYNIKLRDIINSCLNNMDDEPDVAKLTAAMKNELSGKKVGEHIAKESNKPQSQENVIAYFDARLQRLEDNLLNKIEQNTQKIIDLKKTIKQTSMKKSTSTQTYFAAEETKRMLYKQMSQYLTSDTNSLIYEELFMKHVSRTVSKRRKRRHNDTEQ